MGGLKVPGETPPPFKVSAGRLYFPFIEPTGSNEHKAQQRLLRFGPMMLHRLVLVCVVPLGLLCGVGCQDRPGPLVTTNAEVEPSFVCPLLKRDLDPVPEAAFDPMRVGQLPSVGRHCEIPSKVLHRLNRAEYDNATKGVFGVDIAPARGFPTDQRDHGFDNIAAVQSVSPILVEKYFVPKKRKFLFFH